MNMKLKLVAAGEQLICEVVEYVADRETRKHLESERRSNEERPEEHRREPGYGMHLRVCRVLSVGPKVDLSRGYGVGSLVLAGRYSGSDFEWNEKDYMTLHEEDLLGVLHEE